MYISLKHVKLMLPHPHLNMLAISLISNHQLHYPNLARVIRKTTQQSKLFKLHILLYKPINLAVLKINNLPLEIRITCLQNLCNNIGHMLTQNAAKQLSAS